MKLTSNNREIIKAVPRSDRSKLLNDLDLGKDVSPKERAMSLWWYAKTDSLCFKVNLNTAKPCTRLGILSVINSVFNPLELILRLFNQQKFFFRTCASLN